MDNTSSISPCSSTSPGSSSSSPSPPTSPVHSSSSSSQFRPSKTSAKTKRSQRRISEVCDSCKKKKRRCNLKEPCGSCQTSGLKCTYKRYSLNVKFPQLASGDLDTVSQLLVQLDESKDSQTTTSLKTALSNSPKRLGISLDEFMDADSDQEEEEESDNDQMDLSDQVETVEDFESSPDSAISDDASTMRVDYEPCYPAPPTRRQTRSSIKLAPLSIPASPSTRTGAYPAPLPPSSIQVISPMRYHFPGLFLSQ